MTISAPTPQEIADFLSPLEVSEVEIALTNDPQQIAWTAVTSDGIVRGTAEIKTDHVGHGVRMWTELRCTG